MRLYAPTGVVGVVVESTSGGRSRFEPRFEDSWVESHDSYRSCQRRRCVLTGVVVG